MQSFPTTVASSMFALGALLTSATAQCAATTHTATWGPIGVSWPTFTCTINCPGVTTNVAGTVSVPRYNGPGQLTQVTVQVDWLLGGNYSGSHTGNQFSGIIAQLDSTVCCNPPGVGQQCCAAGSVTSAPMPTTFPFVGFGLNASACTIGPLTVPAAALAQYTGGGTVSIPINASFLQRVYHSNGSITGQYALGGGATLATITVTYCASHPSSVTPYGTGCPGTSGLTPQPSTNSQPTLGNAGFAFTVASGLPNAPALLCLATASGSTPLGGGCTLLLDPSFVVQPLITLDAAGSGQSPFPLPSSAALLGFLLFGQFGVIDPAGAFAGFLALSQGLQVKVGT
jgi:hypothetical protein